MVMKPIDPQSGLQPNLNNSFGKYGSGHLLGAAEKLNVALSVN